MSEMNYESRMRERVEALREHSHVAILAVESSCDETTIAVVEDGRIERALICQAAPALLRRCK